MELNKINGAVYTAISNFSNNDDGSISARYVVGTGRDENGEVVDFTTITATQMYLTADEAKNLVEMPMTTEDVGKTPNSIMLGRIYNFLKEKGDIIV